MPTFKHYMLPSHKMSSCKKSVISPSISHSCTFVHSTISVQNIQYTSVSSKFVICSIKKSKHVNSDFNVIRKNAVNSVSDSVNARVSSRPPSCLEPSDFAPQYSSDSIKCPKWMTWKTFCFCQDSISANNDNCLGRKKNNTMLNGFNDHYIKNTCFVSAFFGTFTPFIICK